jgi:hypothetical protein
MKTYMTTYLSNSMRLDRFHSTYREKIERLNCRVKDVVGEEHFAYLYSPARKRALVKRSMRAGWTATGLFSFQLG